MQCSLVLSLSVLLLGPLISTLTILRCAACAGVGPASLTMCILESNSETGWLILSDDNHYITLSSCRKMWMTCELWKNVDTDALNTNRILVIDCYWWGWDALQRLLDAVCTDIGGLLDVGISIIIIRTLHSILWLAVSLDKLMAKTLSS